METFGVPLLVTRQPMTSIDVSVPRLESERGAVRRLADRVTNPEHPFATLTAYYVLLVAVAAIVLYLLPSARAMVSGERLSQLMKGHLFDSPGATSLARPTVEGMLATEARRFELAEVEKNSKGRGVLKYRIRLAKSVDPRSLEDAR